MARKSQFSNLSIEWDDEGLRKFFDNLSESKRQKFYKQAIDKTLESTKKLVQSAASAQGFAKTGPASNNGWDWDRRGRLPKAITKGKIWATRGQAGGRVYTKTAKTAPESARSPAANAFITGYRQFVPTGEPGKGNARFTKNQPPRPVYKLVAPMVPRIFKDNLRRAALTAIRKGRGRA